MTSSYVIHREGDTWIIRGSGGVLTSGGEFATVDHLGRVNVLRENKRINLQLSEREQAIFMELNYILSAVLLANAGTKKES